MQHNTVQENSHAQLVYRKLVCIIAIPYETDRIKVRYLPKITKANHKQNLTIKQKITNVVLPYRTPYEGKDCNHLDA